MNKSFNEASHTLNEVMKGKGAKNKLDIETVYSVEGDDDEDLGDRIEQWKDAMQLAEDAIKGLPVGRRDRRLAEQALGKMGREFSVESLHAHVEALVRSTCTSPVRAAFAVIKGEQSDFEGALDAVNSISDEDAKDIRLSKSKLREVLKEYYEPSNATLADAGIDPGHRIMFRKPNVGSTNPKAKRQQNI